MGVDPGKLPMLVPRISLPVADGGSATLALALMPVVTPAWWR
jgi:hypothetical protein